MKITVIGGGSTGIAVASDMKAAGHDVTLFELEAEGKNLLEIQAAGEVQRIGFGPVGAVKTPRITFDPAKAVPEAEVIFIAVVSTRHKEIFTLIAPYLHDGQAVCVFNACSGSIGLKRMLGAKDVLVGETVANYTSVRYAGNATVDYATPITNPMQVAAFPARDSKRFAEKLRGCYPCICYPETPVKNVLEAGANSGNTRVHIACTLLCLSAVERSEDFRLYRDGLCQSSLKLMSVQQDEITAVLKAFGYDAAQPDALGLMNDLVNFEAQPKPELERFRMTTGPSGASHRYLTEDAFAGNSLIISMGKAVGVDTPVLSGGVALASALNDRDFYKEGYTLENWGLAGMSVAEIDRYMETGEK